MVTSAAAARAISSRASSADLPVAIDCAETAGIPEASSSVNEARKTAADEPKCSTSFLVRVGPRPGVSEIASHSSKFVTCGDAAVWDTKRTVLTGANRVKVIRHIRFANIVDIRRAPASKD